MQKLFRNALLTSFATLALAACDSQAENEVEQQATALDEAAEADAGMMESFAQGAPDEQAVEQQSEAVAQQGEQLKDSLENSADEMDETPQ